MKKKQELINAEEMKKFPSAELTPIVLPEKLKEFVSNIMMKSSLNFAITIMKVISKPIGFMLMAELKGLMLKKHSSIIDFGIWLK